MVRVTGVVWLIAPDVPVTITVTVLVAGLLELEPQPTVNSTPSTSRANALAEIPCFHAFGIGLRSRLRAANTIPKRPSPENGSQLVIPDTTYPVGGAIEAAVRVKLEGETLAPGVIVVGEKVQVTPAGAFVQLNEIVPLNPPLALALIEILVDSPGATVAACVERASVKPAVVTADPGTSVANKPLVCVLPPAVKYRVFGSPVPPSPNTMSHKPGFPIDLFALSCTWPRNFPVGSKASIVPSPKLPTRMAFENIPNAAGVATTPQGAFS